MDQIPSPFKFSPPDLLCSAEGDGDGDGGGGDGNAGDNKGAGLDEKTQEMIMRVVNASVTNQLGRKMAPAIQEGVAAAITPLQESINKLSAAPPAAAKPQPRGPDPQVAEMMREQEKLKAQLESERKAREDGERARQSAELDTQITGLLNTSGVEPLRLKGALAVIRGQVFQTDSGPVMRTTRRGYEEDLTVNEGIEDWLGTDEGKSYVAARTDVGGAGSQPGRSGGRRPGNKPLTAAEAKAQAKQEARANLRAAASELLSGGHIAIGGQVPKQ